MKTRQMDVLNHGWNRRNRCSAHLDSFAAAVRRRTSRGEAVIWPYNPCQLCRTPAQRLAQRTITDRGAARYVDSGI